MNVRPGMLARRSVQLGAGTGGAAGRRAGARGRRRQPEWGKAAATRLKLQLACWVRRVCTLVVELLSEAPTRPIVVKFEYAEFEGVQDSIQYAAVTELWKDRSGQAHW